MQQVTRKCPGGKMLRLKAGVEKGKLRAPQLSGDFFLMPPEGIKQIEEAMEGFAINDPQALKETIAYVIEREHIRLAGIAPEDIAQAAQELSDD